MRNITLMLLSFYNYFDEIIWFFFLIYFILHIYIYIFRINTFTLILTVFWMVFVVRL